MTTSSPKGRARRAEIIETATEAFSRGGFAGASIMEISAAVGLTRAGLLHHFSSKEDLLIAVLQRREEIDRGVFVRSMAGAAPGIGILRGIVNLARRNETVPGLVRLFVVLSAEATDPAHPAHGYFVAHYARIHRGTADALRAVRRHGALRDGVDPEAFATRLVALQDGLQLQWLLDPRPGLVSDQLEHEIQQPLLVDLWE